MGDTMFTIFGSDLDVAQRKPAPLGKLPENALAAKKSHLVAAKGLTPRLNAKSANTPNDPKRKTFLQNEGASIQQTFCPPRKVANNAMGRQQQQQHQAARPQALQVYEDAELDARAASSDKDAERAEFNRKPMFYEDSPDDEFLLTDVQLDQIAFGLPSKEPIPPDCDNLTMFAPDEPEYSISDVLEDCLPEPPQSNVLRDDFSIDLPEMDLFANDRSLFH